MSESESKRRDIANRLRLAREQAGLSQGQVAKLLGLNRPTVTEIEAGRRKVPAEELVLFSGIYDVTISWLLNEESDVVDPAAQLAARELAKLKKEDLDRLLRLLKTLRKNAE